MNSDSQNEWWDGRNENSFFPGIYKLGDNSREGHLLDRCLTLEERTQRECDMIEHLLPINRHSKILDCPCGYGRHTIELASRGYQVWGVDLCGIFLKDARSTAAKKKVDDHCKFIQSDMRNLPESLTGFDICLNMFLSFGFFSHIENMNVLSNFRRILKKGGVLLIHSDINPVKAYNGQFKDRETRTLKNGKILKVDETFDNKTGMLHGKWIIKNGVKLNTKEYAIRIYTNDETLVMMEKAGFSECHITHPFKQGNSNLTTLPQEVVYVATV